MNHPFNPNRHGRRRRHPHRHQLVSSTEVPDSLGLRSFLDDNTSSRRGHLDCLSDAISILKSARIVEEDETMARSNNQTPIQQANASESEIRLWNHQAGSHSEYCALQRRSHSWPTHKYGNALYSNINDYCNDMSPEWSVDFAMKMARTVKSNRDDDYRSISSEQRNPSTVEDSNDHPFQSYLTAKDLDYSNAEVLGSGSFNEVIRVDVHHKPFALKHVKKVLLHNNNPIDTLATTNTPQKSLSFADFAKIASRLSREARILSALNHPNVVKIHGWSAGLEIAYAIWRRHDSFFLLLELLERERLDHRIRKWKGSPTYRNPREEAERLFVCKQIVDALQYIHTKKIAYLNLKPQNIGFAATAGIASGAEVPPIEVSSSHIKLFDFGNAIPLYERGRSYANTILEDEARIFGDSSFFYTAPEVFLGQSIRLESDTFSFGILSYEVLSLNSAYEPSMTRKDYEKLVCTQGHRPVPSLSEETTDVTVSYSWEYFSLLAKCWRTDPSERISLASLGETLDSLWKAKVAAQH